METAKAAVAVTPAGLARQMSILPEFRTAPELAIPSFCVAVKQWVKASAKSFSSLESGWASLLPPPAFVSFSERQSARAIPLPYPQANVFSSATLTESAWPISLLSQ